MMEETGTWSSDEDSQVRKERESTIAKRIRATPAAVFFDQQRKKAREQRMKDMRKALLEHMKDVPEVVLNQRLHLNAFHPPSFYPKHVERIHTKREELAVLAATIQGDELTEEKVKQLPEVYRDAETGEVIKLTKAKWSSVEGRLNYNRQSIIDMGTGRLNIQPSMSPTTSMKECMSESMKESVHSIPSHEKWDPSMETMSITNDRPHPLVKKFLADGPINLRVHKLWSPKTDALIPQPELRVLYVEDNDKIDEDNVSAKSSLSGGTAAHLSKNISRIIEGSNVSSHGSMKSHNNNNNNNNNAVKKLGSIFSNADSGTIGPLQMLQPVTSVHIIKTPISSPPRSTVGKSRSHTLPSLSHQTQSPVEAVETAFGSVSSLGSGKKGLPTKNKKAGSSSMTLSLSSSDRPLAIHETPTSPGPASITSATTSKSSKGGISSVKLGSIWKRPDRTYENEVLYQWYFSRLTSNKLNDSLSSVSSYNDYLHDGSKLKLDSSIGGSLTMGSATGGWQRLEDGYFQQLYHIATEMDKLRILRSDKGLGTGFGVGNGIDHASLAIALDPNPPPMHSMKDILRNLEIVSEKEFNYNKLQEQLTADVFETLSVRSMDSQNSSVGSIASSSSQNSSQRLGKYPKTSRKSKGFNGVPRDSSLRKLGNDGSIKSQNSSRVGTSQDSIRNSINIIQDDNNSSIHTLSSSGNGGSSSSLIKTSRNNSRPTTSKSVKMEITSSSHRNHDVPLKNDQSNPSLSARPSPHPSKNPSKHPSKNPSKNPSRNPSQSPSRNPSQSPSRNPSQSPSRCNSSPGRHRSGDKTGGTDKEFTRMGARMGRRTHRHGRGGVHHEDSTLSSKEYDLVESCHIVARFKVNNLIELARAIKDEEDMIAKKRKELNENKKMSKKLAQNLRKKEKERRHKKRIYLRTLQYDNEIRLMKKMREVKLLW